MEQYQQQFARFQGDVEKHALTVIRDDGLYRHVRCSRGSYAYSFDIITWPGHLCYTGDMGCFVFSRIPDMFEFFRGRETALVDRGYLAEKCLASDKHDGVEQFSVDLFEAAVRSDFEQFTEDWPDDEKAMLWDDISMEVLPLGSDGISAAIQAAMDFRHGGRAVFCDFWDHRLKDYTARFWWCCYAIPWAIARYDETKRSGSPQAADAVVASAGVTTG